MRLPVTLSLYIGRQFLMAVMVTLAVMVVLLGMIELLELVRRAANAPRGLPFGIMLQMVMLKLPSSIERIYPFTFLIGGMVALSRLTRSSELIVARAAGISVWQFLAPGLAVALVLGVTFVAAINPIAALTIARFDRLEGKYISGNASLLSVLPSGLWLRQEGEKNIHVRDVVADEYIIHAVRINQSTLAFDTVTFFLFDKDHHFVGRIDSPEAVLEPGRWLLPTGSFAVPGTKPEMLTNYTMPTHLTLSQIQDSFSSPETFSFWQLPGFIEVLERAGFSAIQHKLHFHSLMALPLLLVGMTLLAAVFSLRQARRGRTGVLAVFGMVTGFLTYFLTNIIYAFGASGGLPIMLAAWAPALILLMMASALLLHLEDG